MQVQPYLFFEGHCEEALEFYKKAVGAQILTIMRFKDSPEPCPGTDGEKVMHASFSIGDFTIFASDGHCGGSQEFKGFALSITVPNPAEATRAFTAIGDGGKVLMPLAKTFYSESFGMVSDRFGVLWMVIVAH